jgi:hypothetical protein
VKDRGESVSKFRSDQIIKEAQRIKHGSLYIGDKRRPGEEVGIPEREGAM